MAGQHGRGGIGGYRRESNAPIAFSRGFRGGSFDPHARRETGPGPEFGSPSGKAPASVHRNSPGRCQPRHFDGKPFPDNFEIVDEDVEGKDYTLTLGLREEIVAFLAGGAC